MCHIPTPHVTAHRKHYFASVLRRMRPCPNVCLAAPTTSMSLARSPCQRSPGLDPAIVGAAMLNYLCAPTISSRRYRYPSRRGASSLPSWPCFRRTRLKEIRHGHRVPLSPAYITFIQPLLLVYRPSSLCQRATFVPALALAVTSGRWGETRSALVVHGEFDVLIFGAVVDEVLPVLNKQLVDFRPLPRG